MVDMTIDKRISLKEAAELLNDGEILALGGMILYRRPVAFVRQLLNLTSPPRDLTLLAFTASFESDLLVGAGLLTHVQTCYFGLEAYGLAPMFTAAVPAGNLSVIEETEASLSFGLRATLAGVGFMPGQGWLGTDLLSTRPDIVTIQDPYTDQEVVAFPAVECDVAVIHAIKADREGNAMLGGNLAVDLELAQIADRTIITAEEIVDQLPGPVDLSGMAVTWVAAAPRGAWPTSCYPLYPVDGGEILHYSEVCPDGFDDYLAEFLTRTPTI
jgi:glutaconate CoA-transferase subunit A